MVLHASQASPGALTTYRFTDLPLDGSTPRTLVSYTHAPDLSYELFDVPRQLSPDGRQIVLADPIDVAAAGGLVIVDLVAGTSRILATGGRADNARWSPDGRQIAYRMFAMVGALMKETGIFVVPAAGGAPRRVWSNDRTAVGGATRLWGWTGDSAGLLISPDSSTVTVLDVRSGAVSPVAGTTYGVAVRVTSPSLALVVDDPLTTPTPTPAVRGAPGPIGHPGHLEVRDEATATGRVVMRYGDVGTLLWGPRWNPRGDEIVAFWVCGAGASERAELVIVNTVSGASRTSPAPACIRSVDWSASGTQIIYSTLDVARVRNADGSNDRELFRPAPLPGTSQQYVFAVAAFAPR